MKIRRILWFFLLVMLLSPPAFAYIDPGSGSAIMSAIVGVFVAVAIAVKGYWYKLKSLFSRKPKHDLDDEDTNH